MTKIEKIHAEIHARFQYRIVAAGADCALLVNDTTRTVGKLTVSGKAYRTVWYEAILKALAAGEKPQPSGIEYHIYAR